MDTASYEEHVPSAPTPPIGNIISLKIPERKVINCQKKGGAPISLAKFFCSLYSLLIGHVTRRLAWWTSPCLRFFWEGGLPRSPRKDFPAYSSSRHCRRQWFLFICIVFSCLCACCCCWERGWVPPSYTKSTSLRNFGKI